MAKQQINTQQQPVDYIQTILSSNHTMSSSSATVPFSSTQLSGGSKLTRSGNAVIVGAGVSRVRVSYSLMADSAVSAPYLFARTRINTSDLSQQLNGPAAGFMSVSETKIFNVSPGDAITIFADCGGGSAILSTGRQSFMLVEVVQ